jgi:imidazole glycerol-phosphate synthase subunit HisF
MLLPRIIPILLLKGKGLVKGVKFKDHKYVGDPINAVQIFNTKQVDELFFLDITATLEKRIPPLDLVQKIADQCLMPFGVGGGIKTVDEAKSILNAGAEKVCLNTYALENPKLIEEISNVFGNQSVIVSIDIKKSLFGKIVVTTRNGSKNLKTDLQETLKIVQDSGAGEILLNNIDRDGTCEGYDLELLQSVCESISIPVIASGGAWEIEHLKEGLQKGKASAVAAGSMFVLHGKRKAVLISYPSKAELIAIRGE